MQPVIIPVNQHGLSRKAMSKHALKVGQHLKKNGFCAYLVGGSVRDMLLGQKPKDFDIATDARPEQIKALFRNCLLIGKRFRIAHIRFSDEIIEVTTFRASDTNQRNTQRLLSEKGMVLRDNVYGTLQEDVWRRDFSVNALYYNLHDETIVDYCQGVHDIQQRRIRIIGEPNQRYQEDPVRLLRAIRLAARFEDFQFDLATERALSNQVSLIIQVSSSRIFEEILKLFHSGHALSSYRLLKKYGLLQQLFPGLINQIEDKKVIHWIETACRNTDHRILAGKKAAPAFLCCVLLWHPLQKEAKAYRNANVPQSIIYQQAMKVVIAQQHQSTTLTRACIQMMRNIWLLQPAFIKRSPRLIKRLLLHQRFRAAYDFLLLRVECQEVSPKLGHWWTELVNSDAQAQAELIQCLELNKQKVKITASS